MIQRRRKRQIMKLALKEELSEDRKKEIVLMINSGEDVASLSLKESQFYLEQVLEILG